MFNKLLITVVSAFAIVSVASAAEQLFATLDNATVYAEFYDHAKCEIADAFTRTQLDPSLAKGGLVSFKQQNNRLLKFCWIAHREANSLIVEQEDGRIFAVPVHMITIK